MCAGRLVARTLADSSLTGSLLLFLQLLGDRLVEELLGHARRRQQQPLQVGDGAPVQPVTQAGDLDGEAVLLDRLLGLSMVLLVRLRQRLERFGHHLLRGGRAAAGSRAGARGGQVVPDPARSAGCAGRCAVMVVVHVLRWSGQAGTGRASAERGRPGGRCWRLSSRCSVRAEGVGDVEPAVAGARGLEAAVGAIGGPRSGSLRPAAGESRRPARAGEALAQRDRSGHERRRLRRPRGEGVAAVQPAATRSRCRARRCRPASPQVEYAATSPSRSTAPTAITPGQRARVVERVARRRCRRRRRRSTPLRCGVPDRRRRAAGRRPRGGCRGSC